MGSLFQDLLLTKDSPNTVHCYGKQRPYTLSLTTKVFTFIAFWALILSEQIMGGFSLTLRFPTTAALPLRPLSPARS